MRLDGKDIIIGKCREEKDLGMVFDELLSFDPHINKAIVKANRR